MQSKVSFILGFMIVMWMFVYGHANEIKDFNFTQRHRSGKACTSPKGRNLTCKVWHFQQDRGFHRRCGRDVFKKLEQSSGGVIAPQRGCVALYDEFWSDMRDFSDITAEQWEDYNPTDPTDPIVMELRRPLLHAKFWQYVEVKRSGVYKFKACMTARFFEEPEYIFVESGMQATLSEWRREGTGEIVHVVLPEKERVPLDMASPGELDAINESTDGLYERDAYTGHAGLLSAYYETSRSDTARYICHTQDIYLNKGFYVARGRVNPALRFDDEDGVLSNYDGWGAINHMSLRRQK